MASATERVLKYFEKVSIDPENVMRKCLIPGCGKLYSGKKPHNLVLHVQKQHKEFYHDHIETDASKLLNMPYQRLHYIQCCTEFVTANGEPFAALRKSGFVKLNADEVQKLKDAGYGDGLGTKCEAVRAHITYLSSQIMQTITAEVQGKFVSVMIDTATKFKRSIMGVSIQYLSGSSQVIRSIGMIHLSLSHTAVNISEEICKQLNLFDIKMTQISSITTDNASNMIATIDRCNEMCDEEFTDSIGSVESADESDGDKHDDLSGDDREFYHDLHQAYASDSHEDLTTRIRKFLDVEEPSFTEEEPMNDESPEFEKLLRDLEKLFVGKSLSIHGIRCAAHTLQLAVIGALKHPEYLDLFRLCKVVCKELHKEKIARELEENNIKFKPPNIDCLTRWNSTYKMLLQLIENCEAAIIFLAQKPKSSKCFELILLKWPIITAIMEVLKLPYDVTMGIQHSAYTLSDFYGDWMQMTRKLEKMTQLDGSTKDFARILLDQTKKRESSVMNSSAMLSAVYLDPRYKFFLNESEVRIAKITLTELHTRVSEAKLLFSQSQPKEQAADEDSFEEECVKKGLSRTFYEQDMSSAGPTDINSANLFEAYERTDRIHHKNSILKFWDDHSNEHPALYELASIIHAIPPSQATVERAFSVLGYIYNHKRTRLAPETLENILMIILNRDLVEPIHQRDLDAILKAK